MISLKELARVVLFLIALSVSPVRAAIFMAAHPDDIALMMHKNAANDVSWGYHTVFILTTAGDAGNGAYGQAGNTMNMPYYRARLKSYEDYVHFWQGLNPSTRAPVPTHATVLILGKRIEAVHMGNVDMYNLNLPDNQTLLPFAKGQIPALTSLSPVNSYTLPELVAVIREIIRINFKGEPTINLNTQDPDTTLNPQDHPDHQATGLLADLAVRRTADFRCVNLLLYRGYTVENLPPTYSAADAFLHNAALGVLNASLIANGNASTWDAFHNNFVGKMDFRGMMGAGYCNF